MWNTKSLKILKGAIRGRNRRTVNIMAKIKRTNNYLQNTTQKTKDPETRTSLKPGDELKCFGSVSSSCFTCDTRRVTLVTHQVISHE